jgi:3-oxoadipate enol-lactonase
MSDPRPGAPVRLAASMEGTPGAPVLVLGNSIGTTRAVWDPQAAALRAHFRLLRFEYRGHGRSPAPGGPYSIGDLAGDVLALLDAYGVERALYCGISLGGMVGMWLAVARAGADRRARAVLHVGVLAAGLDVVRSRRAGAVVGNGASR